MSRAHLARPASWPSVGHRKRPLRDRFCVKVRQGDNGCWEWAGAHAANGYAQIGHHRRVLYAHRVAYELFVGPIPPGLHIDHLCRNRGCVRPTHLEPVTQAENNPSREQPALMGCPQEGPPVTDQTDAPDTTERRADVEVWRDPTNTGSSLELAPQAFRLAQRIANTEFVPDGLRNRPDAVLAAILWGREVGLTEIAALQSVHVVKGRIGTSAESMRARILGAGHTLDIVEMTATRCEMVTRRAGSDTEMRFTFTMEDAARAKLDRGENWLKYPTEMLLARCTSRMARAAYPDVLAGLSHTPEELGDLPAATPPARRPARAASTEETTDPWPDPEPADAAEDVVDAEVVPDAPADEPSPGSAVAGEQGTLRGASGREVDHTELHANTAREAPLTPLSVRNDIGATFDVLCRDHAPNRKLTQLRNDVRHAFLWGITQSTTHVDDLDGRGLLRVHKRLEAIRNGFLNVEVLYDVGPTDPPADKETYPSGLKFGADGKAVVIRFADVPNDKAPESEA